MFTMVSTTCDSKEAAEKIAHIVLNQRLAACVQISDTISSHYRWKGEIVQDQEFLVTMKTRKAHFAMLTKLIKDNHPYEIPEIISVELSEISKEYHNWLQQETKREQERE
ncbi:MAG: divalent-cation tolerance protein CutA [Desulfobulbaceae bacterium]|nr:MAG: divalent-cation tolerance protein CutA [Desulfobulbaceae bacterium]